MKGMLCSFWPVWQLLQPFKTGQCRTPGLKIWSSTLCRPRYRQQPRMEHMLVQLTHWQSVQLTQNMILHPDTSPCRHVASAISSRSYWVPHSTACGLSIPKHTPWNAVLPMWLHSCQYHFCHACHVGKNGWRITHTEPHHPPNATK